MRTDAKKYAGTSGYYTILDDMNPDLWVIKKTEAVSAEAGAV